MFASHRASRYRGFTLIEILVVMAIVTVLLGLAVVKLGTSDESRLQGAAEDLAMRLENVRDEAVVRGQALAFSSDGQGYQFWLSDLERNEWHTLPAGDVIASKPLPGGVVIDEMRINGLVRPLGERIVFPLSGLTEPFMLTLTSGKSRTAIVSDALGRLEVRHAL